jgi:transposase
MPGPRSGPATSCPVYPTSSITDAQWAGLAPLLPAPGNARGRGGRPDTHPRGLVLDTIFYLVRGGIACAALPHDFPPHQTVYGIFGRWARSGAWQAIHDGLRDLVRVHEGRDPLPTAAIIDSQSMPGATRSYDAGKDQRSQTAHRGGHRRVAARCRGHHRRDRGPRRRPPLVDRAERPVLHDQPGLGRWRLRPAD